MSERTVWKYELTIDDEIDLFIPGGNPLRVVLIGLDPNGAPCLWAEVDPSARKVRRRLYIRGTGHAVPPSANHLGSFLQGPFVWHVFVEPSTEEALAGLLGSL